MKMYDCLLAELFAIMINPISVAIKAPGLQGSTRPMLTNQSRSSYGFTLNTVVPQLVDLTFFLLFNC